jgi:glycosyltransferase involved in cell wall biosynthesis
VQQPTISVCVPTYNGAAFLAETLASISAQTFENYEVLVVDDGSTDSTIDIAESFAASDKRVRVIRNSERAGSSARNANQSAKHARGEWIKFLYQDDVMTPRCLEHMLDAGRHSPFVITWHGYIFERDVDESTHRFYEGLPTLESVLPGCHATSDQFCDAVLTRWGVNFIGPTSSCLIRRDCFDRYGGFNPHIVTFPDLECWIRLGSNEGLAVATERLVMFRVHGTSISAALRGDRHPHRYRHSIEWLALQCKLARAPAYEVIRNRARTHHGMDPEQAAREPGSEARQRAIDGSFHQRDRATLREWNAFCAKHAEVQEVLHSLDAAMSPSARLKQSLKARL